MFLNDLGGNGETEAGATVLGGVEGQKQALANLFGEAVAGVGNLNFYGSAIFGERAAHAEYAEQTALHGLGGIVDEVGERTANGFVIGKDQRQSGFEIALDGDALKAPGKQGERLVGDLVHVAGARLRRRKLGKCRKLIDERAQCSHAGKNDFAAFANDGRRVGLAAIEMPADALGRERDGRQRILDFVGYALRHFFPRELTLSAEKFRSVFDDEDRAGPAVRQFESRAGDGEMHIAAVEMKFDFGGSCAHALAATNHSGEFIHRIRRQEDIELLAANADIFVLTHREPQTLDWLAERFPNYRA